MLCSFGTSTEASVPGMLSLLLCVHVHFFYLFSASIECLPPHWARYVRTPINTDLVSTMQPVVSELSIFMVHSNSHRTKSGITVGSINYVHLNNVYQGQNLIEDISDILYQLCQKK